MANQPDDKDWGEKQIPLKDIVLSNSWALQSILQFLEEIHPGSKDRIWQHYQHMKTLADQAKTDSQSPPEDDYYFDEEKPEDWIDELDPDDPNPTIN